jgi:hypothetical protein
MVTVRSGSDSSVPEVSAPLPIRVVRSMVERPAFTLGSSKRNLGRQIKEIVHGSFARTSMTPDTALMFGLPQNWTLGRHILVYNTPFPHAVLV